MSTQTQAFNTSATYRYAIVGVLGVVAILGVGLFIRSRIQERRRAREGPQLVPSRGTAGGVEKRPRLFDAYLDKSDVLGDYGWGDIMPLSSHPVPASPQNPAKNVSLSLDLDPALASALSRVAALILMPCPGPPLSGHAHDGLEEESTVPYVEVGTIDVEIQRSPDGGK
ncbi:hypothetical protein B0H15DRAFT_296729 [Mycena belliarum]|uniref:Uncharacterized protein n=1 Tax=Mycena belliarum TaxID=1033014 RepID=A0AAD6U5V6_9AGAR|nr:hypothetical protein B0H15DRAFT_296729 [Mycena belliae]